MTLSRIAVDRDHALTIIRLDDAANANALTMTMKDALLPAVDDYFRDSTQRCLIVTGTDRFFCAGGDLATLREGQDAQSTRARLASTHELVRLFLLGEKPVIMAVNGMAAGGGFGLAMLGDIILASEKARFQPAFPAIGVAADVALSMTLPRAVGSVRARHILLNDIMLDAREAEVMGLVAAVHAPDALMNEARRLGKKLASGPTQALGLTKKLINSGFELSLDAFLTAEFAAQAICFGSQDCREGTNAFYERRPPVFTGR